MNLSVIERFTAQGDLSLDALKCLLKCRGECEWLDYKQALNLEVDAEASGFTRDVLGMKNVGGGYIVVGVKDKTWEPIGLSQRLPYDTKLLRDKVRKCSGLDLDVDIVHHYVAFAEARVLFALILVRSSPKRSKRRRPSVVSKDFHAGEKWGIRSGAIYVRKGDSTVQVRTQRELEELLDALEELSDRDALDAAGAPSPFAIEDGLYRLLDKGFEKFIGREGLRDDVLSAVTKDPRIWVINVHGPGGVGKSALVNWATYEFYEARAFEAIIHLTAKERALTSEGIRQSRRSLYSLDDLLDHVLATFEEEAEGDINDKKRKALEWIQLCKTLLVLDNMETVGDGRIIEFLREIPVGSESKVLMTSRKRTGWELPVPVNEMDSREVADFLREKAIELDVEFPTDSATCEQVRRASGGLPLAIEWIMGQYRAARDLEQVMRRVSAKDSPVLEFSFRNVWDVLPADAKAVLAVMTIFQDPPTVSQIAVAIEWGPDRIENALSEIEEVTLVRRVVQPVDGRVVYAALPITLSFAKHQLALMGDLELTCQRRFQVFSEQMELQASEMYKFRSVFERYGLRTDNEKRAAILCRRGESEMFAGNVEAAEVLFQQARELTPQSAYVYAMSASYELAQNRVGKALEWAQEACRRRTQKTGALCYSILARVYDVQWNRPERLRALEAALLYDPADVMTKHQYGVALSRAGRTDEAIKVFSEIITEEEKRVPPTATLLMAYKTRIINLRRLRRTADADRDLARADEILKLNPHLANQAHQIQQLHED